MNEAQKYAYEAQRPIESIDLEGREHTLEEEGQIAELIAKPRQASNGDAQGKKEAQRMAA
jgi:hypothetical protein